MNKIKLIFISIFIILINDVYSQQPVSKDYMEKGAYYKKIAETWICERTFRDTNGNHLVRYYFTTVNNKAHLAMNNSIKDYSVKYVVLNVDQWKTFTEKDKMIEFTPKFIETGYIKIKFNLNTLQMYAREFDNTIDIFQCRKNLY